MSLGMYEEGSPWLWQFRPRQCEVCDQMVTHEKQEGAYVTGVFLWPLCPSCKGAVSKLPKKLRHW